MTYTYKCKNCGATWENRCSYDDRDKPTAEPCASCESKDSVVRTYESLARISYDGAHTVLQRAGSGWNDVLNKIKKNSGRHAKNIQTR